MIRCNICGRPNIQRLDVEAAIENWGVSLDLDPVTNTTDFPIRDRAEELLLTALEPVFPGITKQMHARNLGDLEQRTKYCCHEGECTERCQS